VLYQLSYCGIKDLAAPTAWLGATRGRAMP
jgi:hypothetical protein